MMNTPLTEEPLSRMEEIECAKSYIDLESQNVLFAERRNCELADAFSQLEVQIATILLAFSGLFFQSFIELSSELFADTTVIFVIKWLYVLSIFLFIVSLSLGLIHIRRKEIFWDERMVERQLRLKKWASCVRKEITFKEAKAYQEGTALEPKLVIFSPKWTWILQTIFLGLAIGCIFILFIVFIFNS